MKAIIKLDVPEYQIGQEVSIYFKDTMSKKGICEAVKERQRPERLLPCKCGCRRRERWYGGWYGSNSNNITILKCCKCGFGVGGKNEIDVHKKWNEAVKNEKENV